MDPIDRLYEVADDHESDVLDALRERAGLIWTCYGPHKPKDPEAWTNQAGQPCEVCGKYKETK
jgi:hypothetical protein